ncbi:MAG: YlxR family protein [Clostridia bacterium]
MKTRKVPMRMCVACRTMKSKKELVRIVRDTEGIVHVDKTGKKSGKGAYVCPDILCMEKARKHRSLERALEATLPEGIYHELEAMIQSRK